jgi:hypothetical protein
METGRPKAFVRFGSKTTRLSRQLVGEGKKTPASEEAGYNMTVTASFYVDPVTSRGPWRRLYAGRALRQR